jgi:hypothetical protein
MMAVLAGKLEARRDDCAPVAGKSTLNRLELSRELLATGAANFSGAFFWLHAGGRRHIADGRGALGWA